MESDDTETKVVVEEEIASKDDALDDTAGYENSNFEVDESVSVETTQDQVGNSGDVTELVAEKELVLDERSVAEIEILDVEAC